MASKNYHFEEYQTTAGGDSKYKVLVVKINSPDQVLTDTEGSIHQCLRDVGIESSIGLYFYRFKNLKNRCFTKIGEVSNRKGIIERKKRGWLAPTSYSDTYKKGKGKGKMVFEDILAVSSSDPIYFIYYQFDIPKSFPKIDEIRAFHEHNKHFKKGTRNVEPANKFHELGSELVWYPSAFEEVLNLRFPSGTLYF